MATVWAPRIGSWTEDPDSGWSHTIAFDTLSDLMDSMQDADLRGKVNRLGIVAHGSLGGVVQLNPTLTVRSMPRSDLQRLRLCLRRHAMLIFYSCVAGKGEPGSHLLVALSGELPGRTIVGFTVYGCAGGVGWGAPGNMQWSTDMNCSAISDTRLSPWIEQSKWAFDGNIVRWPSEEQVGREGFRCGNPRCEGHDTPRGRCRGWAPAGLAAHHP